MKFFGPVCEEEICDHASCYKVVISILAEWLNLRGIHLIPENLPAWTCCAGAIHRANKECTECGHCLICCFGMNALCDHGEH